VPDFPASGSLVIYAVAGIAVGGRSAWIWSWQGGQAVWSNLRRSLANLTKQGLDQLTALIKIRLKRMRYRPGLIDGFIAKTGLDLTLP
jgi:hypothetical protein